MTFGSIATDLELARMAPVDRELAKAFAAELGHTRPAEKLTPCDHAGVGVECRGRCHRLYPYRIVASKRHVAYLHCRGVTAAVVEVVHSWEMLSLS